ncbi:unnamed protein product [Rodentolepis nana]|uniref:Uncharacterized protein n=1 Tax=Rodentolepis nana TaxID=102285 RepID=A0A3P7SH15_RODNA|nr:unnamed protein product [Rodentolepis nana]
MEEIFVFGFQFITYWLTEKTWVSSGNISFNCLASLVFPDPGKPRRKMIRPEGTTSPSAQEISTILFCNASKGVKFEAILF